MYKTLVVLKESKFNETKFSHPSNIDSISVTCEVSKLFTFKDINLLQPLNISHIISTFFV